MKNKQFRTALVMAKYAASQTCCDGAGVEYLMECFDITKDEARTLWFNSINGPAQRINSDTTLYKEVAMLSNPFERWEIDKDSRMVILYGRSTNLFNY
jgi:hypothetical protein